MGADIIYKSNNTTDKNKVYFRKLERSDIKNATVHFLGVCAKNTHTEMVYEKVYDSVFTRFTKRFMMSA